MALDDILAAISEEAAMAAADIASDAAARAAIVVDGARSDAESERRRLASGRDDAARRIAAAIVNRAALEADRALRAAQDELFSEVLAAVAERLAGVRGSDAYPGLFERLLIEALDALPDATRIGVDPADLATASQTLERLGRRLSIESAAPCWGGMTVSTDDGRRVMNTLESRLDKALPTLRRLAGGMCPALLKGAS